MSSLRIAFFGSDYFSLHSLSALNTNRLICNIEKLHLITRPPKYTGRGRKLLRDAVTADYAAKQDIPLLRAESSKDICDLKNEYNMTIAVSYGKLIPAEFLSSLAYGGLNVHPSLLPEFRGSSPLQSALLTKKPFTGVSVQTLHPTKFDHGAVLYQSDEIPIVENETVNSLRDKLGPIGANGLITVLKERRFEDIDRYSIHSKYQSSNTPKIKKEMTFLNPEIQTVDNVKTICRVLGSMYAFQHCAKKKFSIFKRVIIHDVEEYDSHVDLNLQPGEYLPIEQTIVLRLQDGYIKIKTIQFEGAKKETPEKFIGALHKRGITRLFLQQAP